MELNRETIKTQDEIIEEKIIQLQEDLVNMGFTTLGPLAAMELFLMVWKEQGYDKKTDVNGIR